MDFYIDIDISSNIEALAFHDEVWLKGKTWKQMKSQSPFGLNLAMKFQAKQRKQRNRESRENKKSAEGEAVSTELSSNEDFSFRFRLIISLQFVNYSRWAQRIRKTRWQVSFPRNEGALGRSEPELSACNFMSEPRRRRKLHPMCSGKRRNCTKTFSLAETEKCLQQPNVIARALAKNQISLNEN